MTGYITPLVGIPSSLVEYPKGLLVWLFIQSPTKILMLHIKVEKRQNNMSGKITWGGV